MSDIFFVMCLNVLMFVVIMFLQQRVVWQLMKKNSEMSDRLMAKNLTEYTNKVMVDGQMEMGKISVSKTKQAVKQETKEDKENFVD